MRIAETKVYSFKELSDEAKQEARNNYMNNFGYAFGDDAIFSLKKGCEAFGGSLQRYSIDFFESSPSSAVFDMPELSHDEIKEIIQSLGEVDPETGKGAGDCMLTGYCADEDVLDGIREAFNSGIDDINILMQRGFVSWLKACQDDCECSYKDEAFGEHCDSNEYEFTEHGKMW